jgi:S1-C subfamily serine protease
MFRTSVDLESLSLASHYLRMIPDGVDNPLATGTGFIYEYDKSLYLITNAHNVTRVNPETNQ